MMSPMGENVTSVTIRSNVSRIIAMQIRLDAELAGLRTACPHADKQGEYKGNTGNYCQQDDSYWIAASCLDCGKNWHIDSTETGYRQFEGKIIK